MTGATAVRSGRPRSREADRAIVAAALDVVAADGVGAFCVEAVAARAGVSKTTIYRRFPSKEALLTDALGTLNDDLPPTPDTGSVRSDLVTMLERWQAMHDCTHTGQVMPRMLSAARTHPELYATYYEKVVEPRRERFRVALRRGVARGEVRADVDVELATTAVIGPMLLLLLASPASTLAASGATPAAIVDLVLDGLRP